LRAVSNPVFAVEGMPLRAADEKISPLGDMRGDQKSITVASIKKKVQRFQKAKRFLYDRLKDTARKRKLERSSIA
jgi:hypothetical protein